MSTFALVHGAWGSGWHWAGVPDALRAMGHEVVAPDLPCEDPEAAFEDYAQVVIDALAGAGDDVVVVGYSIGGQTAPLVAARRAVRELVYVGALLVEPGSSLLDQFGRGGQLLLDDYLAGIERPADRSSSHWVDFDVYHRVSCQELDEPAARERFARSRAQAVSPYAHPCPLSAQPEVPTRYVALADDRLVNNAHWLPVVRERLGIEPVGMPGDHSPMAGRPDELAALLAGQFVGQAAPAGVLTNPPVDVEDELSVNGPFVRGVRQFVSAVSSEPVGALGGADYRLRQRFDTDVRLAGLHGSRVPRRIRSKSRIPRVLTGSTPYAIFCRPSREATGNFYIDDEVLAAEGITDLSGYRCGDAAEEDLATDLFV